MGTTIIFNCFCDHYWVDCVNYSITSGTNRFQEIDFFLLVEPLSPPKQPIQLWNTYIANGFLSQNISGLFKARKILCLKRADTFSYASKISSVVWKTDFGFYLRPKYLMLNVGYAAKILVSSCFVHHYKYSDFFVCETVRGMHDELWFKWCTSNRLICKGYAFSELINFEW